MLSLTDLTRQGSSVERDRTVTTFFPSPAPGFWFLAVCDRVYLPTRFAAGRPQGALTFCNRDCSFSEAAGPSPTGQPDASPRLAGLPLFLKQVTAPRTDSDGASRAA